MTTATYTRLTARPTIGFLASVHVLAACLSFVLTTRAATGASVGCGEATDEARAAVAAAEAQVGKLWTEANGQRAIGYRLKGETGPSADAPGPRGGLLFPKPAPAAAAPIDGILAIEKLDCAIFEVGPPRAFVVSYRATGLRFKEGAGPWSPRIARGLVHQFAVRRSAESWAAAPLPGARTSLPDDAAFHRPAEPVEVPPAPAARKR